MKLSICSYTFEPLTSSGKMDCFGYLETCRYRYGLSGAELWNGTLASLDKDYLIKVKEGLDEREMELACLTVDGPYLWDDKLEVREQHYQQMLEFLKAAELLGARAVRIDAGGGHQDMKWSK